PRAACLASSPPNRPAEPDTRKKEAREWPDSANLHRRRTSRMRGDLRARSSSFSPLHSGLGKYLCKAHVPDRLVEPAEEIVLRAIPQKAMRLFNIGLHVRQITWLGSRLGGREVRVQNLL